MSINKDQKRALMRYCWCVFMMGLIFGVLGSIWIWKRYQKINEPVGLEMQQKDL